MEKVGKNEAKLPPERNEYGQLLPGRASINPKGRPRKSAEALKAARLQREQEDLLDADFNERVDYLLKDGGTLPADEMPEPKPLPVSDKPQHDENGKFAKGNAMGKIKPPGRPKNVTPEDIRKRISRRIHRVVDTLFDQAEGGDTAASKLLLDRFVPSLKMTHNVSSDINTLPRLVVVSQDAHEQVDKALVTDAEIITEDTAGVDDVPREIRDKGE
ncbi:MAG: hypothetical protein GY703_09320 [Gammaproteobacteria bacterium]|nr:hypothetical protein [Gammaproteobacteria bacterium]